MNKDKKEPEYPGELESQFILRLPEEPAKALRELLRSGDSLKNRLTIQIENDMRNGEVRFDHWAMHGKIIDLPTIIESLKTIDNKSFYKTADICQMMICKEEPDQTASEEDTPSKNKKKDPYKVEKKYLWPHGITPPTKNVRKRRFRKTLKKKYVEAPEIEKEVKRLLRADNEACQLSWEVVFEDDESLVKSDLVPQSPVKPEKKPKAQRKSKKKEPKAVTSKRDSVRDTARNTSHGSSNVVDIFGGAVSDSDAEEERINVQMEKCHMSPYRGRSSSGVVDSHKTDYSGEFDSPPKPTAAGKNKKKSSKRRSSTVTSTVTSLNESPAKASTSSTVTSTVTSAQSGMSSADEKQSDELQEDLTRDVSHDLSQDNMTFRIEQLRVELEELKQRRQRTRHEISGMENLALRQRFQDILHTLNQDVMYKEMEYQGLITLQNSEDI
ncbi:transcription initiation factor TFIID subunit 7-like [Bicyclus anynana]|uniref:Transcription initiation factor TFIID subunit 7-like n=1 Tax=Bicyclus anynana TaxID=110368 RepID=A0A6J1N9C6_BICAN|nr:transcription initiation factor TFIID subunit 7-like [Bicyclus anynana]